MSRLAALSFSKKVPATLKVELAALALIVALGAVAGAFYAQSLVVPNLQALARPAELYLAAAVVFALVFHSRRWEGRAARGKSGFLAMRVALGMAGLGVMAFCWWQVAHSTKDFLPLYLWPLSATLLLAGVAGWPARRAKAIPTSPLAPEGHPGEGTWKVVFLRKIARLSRMGVILPAILFLCALAIRLYHIEELPTFLGDETVAGVFAQRVVISRDLPVFALMDGTPVVLYAIMGFFYSSLGETIAALRLPNALYGALEVLFAYVLGKELGGRKVGLISAMMVATLAVHVHFSRASLAFEATSLSWTGGAAFLARGIRRGSWLDWTLAGLIAGFGVNYYHAARLLPVVMAVFFFGLLILRPRPLRWLLPGLLLLSVGYLVGVGPVAASFWANSGQLLSRSSESWLPTAYAAVTNPASLPKPVDVGQLAWDHLQKQTLGFNLFGDAHSFYRAGRPLLGPLLSPLFFLGVVALTARLFDWRYLLVATWLWSTFLVLGVGSNVAPVFHRPVALAPLAAVVIGLALGGLGAAWEGVFRLRSTRALYWLAVAGLVAFVAYQQLWDYFPDYTPRENWVVWDQLARYVYQLGPENDVVMVGNLDASSNSPAVRFGAKLGRKNAVFDWKDVNTPIKQAQPGRNLVFILLPSRRAELTAIRSLYPGGAEEELKDSGKVFWVVYRYDPRLK